MGKMRVHELAKELGKENKDILEALEGLGVQVSSHMSTVDEEVCEKIKKKFEKKDGAKEEGKPKKKNIIQVFRPQNSKTGMVRPGQRPGTARPGGPRPQGGAKAPAKGGAPAGHSPARKPEGAVKPQEKPAALAQPQQEPVKAQKNEEAAKTRPGRRQLPPIPRDQAGLPRPEPAQGLRARADPREQLPEETLRIRREDRADPRVREAVFQARETQETEAGTPAAEARAVPRAAEGTDPRAREASREEDRAAECPAFPSLPWTQSPWKKKAG